MYLIYLKLFVFFDLGFIIFKNCVFMGFMYIGLEEEKNGFEKMGVYFVEWAWGGVGLMVIGGIVFNWVGWVSFFFVKFFNCREMCNYCVVIDVVYEVDGKICL